MLASCATCVVSAWNGISSARRVKYDGCPINAMDYCKLFLPVRITHCWGTLARKMGPRVRLSDLPHRLGQQKRGGSRSWAVLFLLGSVDRLPLFQGIATILQAIALSSGIDHIDAAILCLLQDDGRMKRSVIAERVGLSVPSVSQRIRKLEENGVITGYHAVLDARQVQCDTVAFIRLSVDTSGRYDAMIDHLRGCDEIQEIHSVTGDGSHILKAVIRNMASLEDLLTRIQAWPGVTGTDTSVVLSTYKQIRRINVKPEPERRRWQQGTHDGQPVTDGIRT